MSDPSPIYVGVFKNLQGKPFKITIFVNQEELAGIIASDDASDAWLVEHRINQQMGDSFAGTPISFRVDHYN